MGVNASRLPTFDDHRMLKEVNVGGAFALNAWPLACAIDTKSSSGSRQRCKCCAAVTLWRKVVDDGQQRVVRDAALLQATQQRAPAAALDDLPLGSKARAGGAQAGARRRTQVHGRWR